MPEAMIHDDDDSFILLAPYEPSCHLCKSDDARHVQTVQTCFLHRDDLTKHVFITGLPGYGKTNSVLNILLQLGKSADKISFLVIEPGVKSEYHVLKQKIPELKIYNAYKENTEEGVERLKLNMFIPVEGIDKNTHLDYLNMVVRNSFPLWHPLPAVVAQGFQTLYAKGDPKKYTLERLHRVITRIVNRSAYDPEAKARIKGAINVRFTGLKREPKRSLVNAPDPISDEVLFGYPTVIRLHELADDEDKALVMSIILMKLFEYRRIQGIQDRLRHVLVVEEAHRLLSIPEAPGRGDYDQDYARKAVAETTSTFIAEMRAYGQGIILVEQIPSKIIYDAIKNTGTKIIHALQSPFDKEVMAKTIDLNGEQANALTHLKKGEAVVWLPDYAYPILVMMDLAGVKE